MTWSDASSCFGLTERLDCVLNRVKGFGESFCFGGAIGAIDAIRDGFVLVNHNGKGCRYPRGRKVGRTSYTGLGEVEGGIGAEGMV
jgi:hypothetical protein